MLANIWSGTLVPNKADIWNIDLDENKENILKENLIYTESPI